MECISYKKGYKYQLADLYETTIDIKPDDDITTDYINLSTEGRIVIKKGLLGTVHPDLQLIHLISCAGH